MISQLQTFLGVLPPAWWQKHLSRVALLWILCSFCRAVLTRFCNDVSGRLWQDCPAHQQCNCRQVCSGSKCQLGEWHQGATVRCIDDHILMQHATFSAICLCSCDASPAFVCTTQSTCWITTQLSGYSHLPPCSCTLTLRLNIIPPLRDCSTQKMLRFVVQQHPIAFRMHYSQISLFLCRM